MHSAVGRWTQRAVAFLGIEHNTTSHREKIIASLGAMLGIAAVVLFSFATLEGSAASLMVASMGASAVLLFVVPHGALSQPWPIVGGHLLSALIGVSCQRFFGDFLLAPALAVGLAVALMCYARCIHPPGGATALAATIGGPGVYELGYGFLLAPVAVNLLAIMAIALIFNNLFAWRRYPSMLMPAHRSEHSSESMGGLTHEDLAAAMESLDTYVDITSEELAELFERAWAHARETHLEPVEIGGGRFYSNGHPGAQWSVRQVIDVSPTDSTRPGQLIYKTVAGQKAFETGFCGADEFQRWARFEVHKKGERWLKVRSARKLVAKESA